MKIKIPFVKKRYELELITIFLGNFFAHGLTFLASIIIGRYLGAEKFGVYILFLSFFLILLTLSDFGIRTSFVKFGSELKDNKSKYTSLLVTVFLAKGSLAVLTSIIIWLSRNKISIFLFDNTLHAQTFGLLGLLSIPFVAFSILSMHFQTIQHFKKYALLNVTGHFFRFIMIVILVMYFKNLALPKYLAIAYPASFSLMALIVIGKSMVRENLPARLFLLEEFIAMLKMGFWIILSTISVLLILQVDVVMLQKLSTSEQVGFYGVAMQISMMLPLITVSLTTLILPKLSEYLKTNTINSYIGKVINNVKYAIVLILFLELSAPFLVQIFYGAQYESSVILLRFLFLAYIISIIMTPISLLFYVKQKVSYLAAMSFIQLIINIVGNLCLIPFYHALGAVFSTLLVRIFGMCYIIYFARKLDENTHRPAKLNHQN